MSNINSNNTKDPQTVEQISLKDINVNDILTAEFEYIAQTAFQANEDRSKVSTFYLVSVGSFIAAILSTQIEILRDAQSYWGFAALFTILSLSGLLTLLQLGRLRQAWFESILAMNQVKNFYLLNGQLDSLKTAFRWKASTVPTPAKPWSIAFLLAVQVALLGGGTAGAAIMFFGFGLGQWWWEGSITVGIIVCVMEIWLYQRMLHHSR